MSTIREVFIYSPLDVPTTREWFMGRNFESYENAHLGYLLLRESIRFDLASFNDTHSLNELRIPGWENPTRTFPLSVLASASIDDSIPIIADLTQNFRERNVDYGLIHRIEGSDGNLIHQVHYFPRISSMPDKKSTPVTTSQGSHKDGFIAPIFIYSSLPKLALELALNYKVELIEDLDVEDSEHIQGLLLRGGLLLYDYQDQFAPSNPFDAECFQDKSIPPLDSLCNPLWTPATVIEGIYSPDNKRSISAVRGAVCEENYAIATHPSDGDPTLLFHQYEGRTLLDLLPEGLAHLRTKQGN